ncbi:PepSY domain-containing protein [Labrys sp. KB_33_2]|uniref:PepSY domain-containing protein n=1 Tax=unclassified Labrys (in: a-proteobacteria) TaxID=2688601 RepID=UPI003EBE4988
MGRLVGALAGLLLLAGVASAQTTSTALPPQGSLKLSQIIAKVEAREGFAYISEVEWSQSGYYEVTYMTTDKAKVELHLDPMSGSTR